MTLRITLLAALFMGLEWSKLPIRYDRPAICESKVCNGAITVHTFTEYQDEEIKTCKRCGTRTILKAEGHTLHPDSETLPDKYRDDYDDKRTEGRKKKRRR